MVMHITITAIMATTAASTSTASTTMPATITRLMITKPMAMPSMSMTSIAVTITAIPIRMTTSRPAVLDPMAEPVALSADEGAALYRLMTWLSPAFPVGAFSYSSGIEWAVEAGDIVDAASLQDWLSAMLTNGSGFCDGVFLAHVHRAATAGNDRALRDVAELVVNRTLAL